MTQQATHATDLSHSEVLTLLRSYEDPLKSTASSKCYLRVREVVRVYETDPDGLREVLFLDDTGAPMTAYLRGRTVAYVADLW